MEGASLSGRKRGSGAGEARGLCWKLPQQQCWPASGNSSSSHQQQERQQDGLYLVLVVVVVVATAAKISEGPALLSGWERVSGELEQERPRSSTDATSSRNSSQQSEPNGEDKRWWWLQLKC